MTSIPALVAVVALAFVLFFVINYLEYRSAVRLQERVRKSNKAWSEAFVRLVESERKRG